MDSWNILSEELNKYKGQIVLDNFRIVELLDLVDGEDDYYWILNDGRKIIWSSCVGSFLPLKENLPEEIYNQIKYTFDINNCFYWNPSGKEHLNRIKENGWVNPDKFENPNEEKLLRNIFGNPNKKTELFPIILDKNTIIVLDIISEINGLVNLWDFNKLPNYNEIAKKFVKQFEENLCLAQTVAFAETFRKMAEAHIAKYPGSGPYENVVEFNSKAENEKG